MSFVNPLTPLSVVLNRLNAPFIVVGSTASSARGVPRSTMDIDLVVRIAAMQADNLAAGLGKEWYADPGEIRRGIETGRAFNLIHIPTGWKIDLFPAQTEFDQSEMERATLETVNIDGELALCRVSTPEDILLSKLRWYRDGGQVSDRQWSDIVEIVRANPAIDLAYLRHWAGRLSVEELLGKAIA